MSHVDASNSFPLRWPAGTPRTEARMRRTSKFDLTFGAARDRLLKELHMLGARYVVLSSNVPLRRDGLPYAADGVGPEDVGVAVYFDLPDEHDNNQQHVIACDRWDMVRDNIRAIGLTVEAIRGMERWGSSEIMRRTLTAFRMLPAPAPINDWRRVLGDLHTAAEVRARYRDLALTAHPDRGGDDAKMSELNAAREAAEKELGT
jgi:hypothetical protein